MQFLYKYIIFISLAISSIYANDTLVDNLLEKAHQASTKDEKIVLIEKLKSELAEINKKAREESDAIIDAKKKIPTKLFNNKK
ncbi:MAG: hypothetical protein WA945_11505 [Arcobacteraceae bacterium]